MKFAGLGVLDGNQELLRMGAIRALYHFMLTYYKKHGIRVINFGGTSPLLSDGLTKFKISLRAYPDLNHPLGEKSFWLIPSGKSDMLKSLLESNPFIYFSNKKIFRALFIEASDFKEKHQFLKFLKRTNCIGYSGTEIYCWDETESISKWIQEEGLVNCEVKQY